MAATAIDSRTGQAPLRLLRAIGSAGAALAMIILGASVLLRLGTVFGADGQTLSMLAPAIEGAARSLHRLAASGVGILAVAATVLCFRQRHVVTGALRPTVWIVAATVVLAVIGPLTTGYRFAAVTVTNVAVGVVLLMSCWWLREALMHGSAGGTRRDPLLRAALVVFLAHVASGAAANALEMRGIRWVAYAHLGTAILVTMFVGAVLWDQRCSKRLRVVIGGTALIWSLQIAFGVALLSISQRPIWLGVLHALLTPLLAAGLVSIAVRSAADNCQPWHEMHHDDA